MSGAYFPDDHSCSGAIAAVIHVAEPSHLSWSADRPPRTTTFLDLRSSLFAERSGKDYLLVSAALSFDYRPPVRPVSPVFGVMMLLAPANPARRSPTRIAKKPGLTMNPRNEHPDQVDVG
jgi:hypothetical protein